MSPDKPVQTLPFPDKPVETPPSTDKPVETPPSTVPVKKSLYDKSLAATANLAKLLPTGTTLAFQTLVPSFTNHGNCYHVNRVFSWGLVGFLGSLCSVLSFTDSITHSDGTTYYGLALPTSRGFYAFNYDYKGHSKDDNAAAFDSACKARRVKPRDFLHAFFRFLVFLSLAFDDAELQTCLVGRMMTVQWKEFLVNMPLAMGFLASFVFMIFPSYRKGIGYDVDGADDQQIKGGGISKPNASPSPSDHQQSIGGGISKPNASPSPSDKQSTGDGKNLIKSSLQITDVTRVVPSTSYELDPIV